VSLRLAALAGLLLNTGCATSGTMDYARQAGAVEEIAAVPASAWLIAGNLDVGAGARFRLVERGAMRVSDMEVDLSAPAPPASSCPGPPDPARWSVSGIALDEGLLFATNHGSERWTVESFALDLAGAQPILRWRTCAMLPAGVQPNAVAADRAGGFYVVGFVPSPAGSTAAPIGSAWHWTPAGGFAEIATGLSGGNGIALSPDGAQLWLAEWGAAALVRIDLASGARHSFALGYLPDNLHFAPDGRLLVTGQRAAVADIQRCGAHCPQSWLVALFDPDTRAQDVLAEGAGTPEIEYATGAQIIERALWITGRGDGRIVRLRLSAAVR